MSLAAHENDVVLQRVDICPKEKNCESCTLSVKEQRELILTHQNPVRCCYEQSIDVEAIDLR